MNVAVVGSTGYIAKHILKRLCSETLVDSVLMIDKSDESDAFLDLTEPYLFDYDSLNNIDIVIFTAAISSPDKCAVDYDFSWKINVVGTSFFIREAIKRKCKVLFFSSDAVFGESRGMIFDEESITSPVTAYGKMKKAIEDEFRFEDGFRAIRLSYVMSKEDRFMKYCIQCIKNNECAEIFHPFYRNVIAVEDVVDVVMFFVFRWSDSRFVFLNVTGKELISRIRMADELNRVTNNRLNYKVVIPEDAFFKNRSRITQMKSLFLYDYDIIVDETFTEKFDRTIGRIVI